MSDNPEDYELVHYGVKGMKWGVRKEERLQRASRVAGGTASRGEKLREFSRTSGHEFARAGGSMKRVYENRANKLAKQKSKVERNQAERQERYGSANISGRNAIRNLEDTKKTLEKARDGKGVEGAVAKIAKSTWGRNGRYEDVANKSIQSIQKDIDKIKKGSDFLERSGFVRSN